jgi:hypothetical protein
MNAIAKRIAELEKQRIVAILKALSQMHRFVPLTWLTHSLGESVSYCKLTSVLIAKNPATIPNRDNSIALCNNNFEFTDYRLLENCINTQLPYRRRAGQRHLPTAHWAARG